MSSIIYSPMPSCAILFICAHVIYGGGEEMYSVAGSANRMAKYPETVWMEAEMLDAELNTFKSLAIS